MLTGDHLWSGELPMAAILGPGGTSMAGILGPARGPITDINARMHVWYVFILYPRLKASYKGVSCTARVFLSYNALKWLGIVWRTPTLEMDRAPITARARSISRILKTIQRLRRQIKNAVISKIHCMRWGYITLCIFLTNKQDIRSPL